MSADPCALTDLDPAMCSHCRGLDLVDRIEVAFTTTAQYRSRCWNCERRIHEGDEIGSLDGEWICQRCFR